MRVHSIQANLLQSFREPLPSRCTSELILDVIGWGPYNRVSSLLKCSELAYDSAFVRAVMQ